MVFKKQGFPEINDLVVCTVKKVLPHSVFVDLDEFEKEGMIHISEIAPGRIRNMRDHVTEGRKIVCKILSINQEKGHINLSLRRVNQSQRISKMQNFKQEIKAQKIFKNTLKELSDDEINKKVVIPIYNKYPSLTESFYDIISDKLDLKELGIDKKLSDKLTASIKEKIRTPEVTISATIKLQSIAPNGVTRIKEILENISKIENVKCVYLGAPNYWLEIVSPDYKEAESKLKKVVAETEKLSKKLQCTFNLKRKSK